MTKLVHATTLTAQLELDSGERVLIYAGDSRKNWLGTKIPVISIYELDLTSMMPGQISLAMTKPNLLPDAKKVWTCDFNEYFYRNGIVRISSEKHIIPALVKDFSNCKSISDIRFRPK